MASPPPELDSEKFSRCNSVPIRRPNPFFVIRMDDLLSTLSQTSSRPLVVRHAVVFERSLVDKKWPPVRSSDQNVLRNRIDQFLKVLLLLPTRFFSPLSVVDIDAGSEPFYDPALFIVHRHFAMKKQSIFAIRAAHAGFRFERPPLAKAACHFWTIPATSSG